MPLATNAWSERFVRAERNPLHLAAWLLIVCALIFAMISIGGYTRLSGSGLSMVDWQPIAGWLPPLSDTQWNSEFERYRQYPEYQFVHPNMTLAQFKSIFWVEFIHRVAGRILAIAFFVPFACFLARGYLRTGLTVRFGAVLVLGGLQGLLGWYMVKSGLADNPSVSQYRLTAHLSLAVALYGYVLWLAVSAIGLEPRRATVHAVSGIRPLALLALALVAGMLISGGFMAGTHAGFILNTYPTMGGQWVPDMLLSLSPAWRNLFENAVTIQFGHRWLAALTLAVMVILWCQRFRTLHQHVKRALDCVLAAAGLQFLLGISTLISRIEWPLALAHQAGFVVLLTALIVLLRLTTPVVSDRSVKSLDHSAA